MWWTFWDSCHTRDEICESGLIQTDVHDGYLHYNALDLDISHRFSSGLQMLASYTWSHTLDNVDPDTTSQNTNDTNFTQRQEYDPAIYDQRHRLILSGVYVIRVAKVHFGGVGKLGSSLPFNIVTGTINSGDIGGTTDRSPSRIRRRSQTPDTARGGTRLIRSFPAPSRALAIE
jgi:hypothetical protein